ncbi:ERF family protein [Leuconostoc citreum]
MTYARRYSLSMAFGIASDVDDDGNGASASNRKQAQPKLISKEKLALLERMITETSEFSGQDMMAFTLKAANVAALKFVTEENYKPLLAKVTEWHQKAEDKSNEPS